MANNPKNLENLKPFKKGQDKRRNVTGENRKLPDLEEILTEVLQDPVNGISSAKAILIALRDKAVKGDIKAAEVLFDRAYGKAKQTIEQSMHVEQPLFPDVSYDNKLN